MASLLRALPVMPGQPYPRQRRLPPVRCLCNGPITSGGIILVGFEVVVFGCGAHLDDGENLKESLLQLVGD